MKNSNSNKNSIRTTMTIKEVACAYFPEMQSESASKCFRREMSRDESLTRKREEAGFTTLKRFLLPAELDIIFEAWGNPFDAE